MSNALRITLSADSSSFQADLAKAKASLQAFANSVNGATKPAASSVDSLGSSITKVSQCLFLGLTAANLFQQGLQRAKDVIVGVIQSTLAMEKAQRTLQYATGDGAGAWLYARKIAKELGIDLIFAADAYGKLAAASRGTSLQGVQTEKIFKSVASASAVMGLSADETKGALNALSQMISKGKVQAEELRGQLGERIPGAFQIAARAMGVTTQALDKMLVDGKLLAEDFLPKFAAQLKKELGDAPLSAANSFQAAINRMKTSWFDFLTAMGKSGIVELATKAVSGLTNAMNGLVTSGGLRLISDLLGNQILQFTTLGTVLYYSLLPALAAVTPALRAFALSAMIAGPVEAAVLAVKALGTAIYTTLGPVGIAIGLFSALAFGISRYSQANNRAMLEVAEANAKAAQEATNTTRSFVQQHSMIRDLEKTIRTNAAGTDQNTKAKQALRVMISELNESFPDLIRNLKKEGDEYTSTSQKMELYAKNRIKILTAEAEKEAAEIQVLRNNISKMLNTHNSKSPILWWIHYKDAIADAEKAAEEHFVTLTNKTKQIATLKAMEDVAKKPKPAGDKPSTKDTVTDSEHEARLARWEAEGRARITLAEQEAAALKKIEIDLMEDLARLQNENKADEKGFKKLSDKKFKDEVKAAKESADRRIEIEKFEYLEKRQSLGEELQSKLTAGENGGLAKRQEAIRKEMADIEKRNNLLAEGDRLRLSSKQLADLLEAKNNAAWSEQVKADLAELKRLIAEESQIRGRRLTQGEESGVTGRFLGGDTSGTRGAAVNQFQVETGKGGLTAGISAGMSEFVLNSAMTFQTWKDTTLQVLNGVQGAFADFFTSLTQQGTTAGQKWDALWKGISKSVIGALSQILAKQLALWIVEKAKHAWEVTSAGVKTALSAKTVAANTVETSSNVATASSGFFKAHSWIPWVGAAIALGFIAMMMSSIKGRAVGGLVTGPELTLLGEKGPEVVAPESDFKDWANSLVNMGANLQGNVTAQLAQARGYDQYSSGLAASASRARALSDGSGGTGAQVDLRGARIFTNNDVEMQRFLKGMLNNLDGLTG